MKVALIGIGRWGQILLKELSYQVEVKYMCDSKNDLEEVFSDSEIRAVFIATPTETHLGIAKRAMKSGRHVFLEKPATLQSSDLEILVALAKDKNIKFAVGYEFIHDPAINRMRELLSGRRIQWIHFEWHKWGTFKEDPVRHLLSHQISIAKHLGVDMTPVECDKNEVISSSDIVVTKFKQASSIINRASSFKENSVTVLTEDGGYVWSNGELYEIDKEKEVLNKLTVVGPSPVSAEISDFLSSINKNTEPQSSGRFALEIYRVIEQV